MQVWGELWGLRQKSIQEDGEVLCSHGTGRVPVQQGTAAVSKERDLSPGLGSGSGGATQEAKDYNLHSN